MNLDEKLLGIFTKENYKQEFFNYKIEKTDKYTDNISIAMGTDGVDWITFEKNLDKFAEDTCKKGLENQDISFHHLEKKKFQSHHI